ncbi:MAG: M28 family peptidase [Bacteroidota bacterium]
MKTLALSLLWILGVWPLFLFAQKPVSPEDAALLSQARAVVDTLCSPTMGGRGYVEEGHLRAATYLANEFERMGFQPMGDFGEYFQQFSIPLNLATHAELSLNGAEVEIGQEFIVNRFTGAGTTEAKVKDLKYGLKSPKSLEGKIALFRSGFPSHIANNSKKKDRYKNLSRDQQRLEAILAAQPAGAIIVKPKLTLGFTRQALSIPAVEVLDSASPKKVKRARISVQSQMTTLRSQNVMGMIPGTTNPDSFLVLTAHYDHLGKLGEAVFPGANDNASGVAMLLGLMEHFSQPENQLDYSLLCIAFGGEETGLVGSRYYVERSQAVPVTKMKFLLNLDLMGNGVDGIMAVGGKDFPEDFADLESLNQEIEHPLPRVRARKNAPNSDHFFFLQAGVPGFFIYTEGGPKHYHDVHDIPTHLQLSRFVEVRELLIRFLQTR